MARAKTTDRSDARRRYRAQLAAEAAAAEAEAAEARAADAAAAGQSAAQPNVVSGGRTPNVITGPGRRPGATDARSMRAEPRPGSADLRPAGKPSMLAAFRIASAPADIRGDLAAFPTIARRTKAVWLPGLLVLVTGAAFLVPALNQNQIVRLLGQSLLAPPAMIPAFLAGMLTQRASWLAGGVAGLMSGLVVAVLVTLIPSTAAAPEGLDIVNLGYLVLVAPLFGIGVGAFAGFYRRFLALSAPPRQPGRRPAQGSKGATRRR